jgi:predicted DCC family thiol-disulfide oxidoreductase YuxK
MRHGRILPRASRASNGSWDSMAESGSPTCLLIYDSRCRMCVTAKTGLERLSGDRELRIIPYESDEAKQVLGTQHHGGRPDAAFLVAADGTIASGLDAFLPLLPGLWGGQLLAKLLAVPLVKPLAYRIYALVARHRYRLFGEVS